MANMKFAALVAASLVVGNVSAEETVVKVTTAPATTVVVKQGWAERVRPEDAPKYIEKKSAVIAANTAAEAAKKCLADKKAAFVKANPKADSKAVEAAVAEETKKVTETAAAQKLAQDSFNKDFGTTVKGFVTGYFWNDATSATNLVARWFLAASAVYTTYKAAKAVYEMVAGEEVA